MPDRKNQDSRTSQSNEPIDELLRERCMRYLLGAMDRDEVANFEVRLESEPGVSDELIAQSNLICLLSAQEIPSADLPVSTSLASSGNGNDARWLSWLAAIAASLLVGVIVWSSKSDTPKPMAKQNTGADSSFVQPDEDLLIAQAWADGPLSLVLTSSSSDEDSDLLAHESEPTWDSLDPNEDSVLNWMMVAVNAGANHEG